MSMQPVKTLTLMQIWTLMQHLTRKQRCRKKPACMSPSVFGCLHAFQAQRRMILMLSTPNEAAILLLYS